MDNFLTADTKAIILLSGVFGKDHTISPLSPTEYNTLARCLVRENLRPAALLTMGDFSNVALGSGIDGHRLTRLLSRGVQLGFAVEEWQSSGLWVISRSDSDYPERYKTHLREKAPPLLFGAGDKSLLHGGGLAIVGSRNVDAQGGEFTRKVAEHCGQNGMPVVSGAARGVDQIAMDAALAVGGVVVGVMADNLLQASVARRARYAIAAGQLLLISPYHPQTSFTVGSAMGRNKLIYALADHALVVSADDEKGGTWAGAAEELQRDNAIAVFVRSAATGGDDAVGVDVPSGNIKLLNLGALPWPGQIVQGQLAAQLNYLAGQRPEAVVDERETLNLFDYQPPTESTVAQKTAEKPASQLSSAHESVAVVSQTQCSTVYEVVLPVLLSHLDVPLTVEELAQIVDVANGQLSLWLEKAVAAGVMKKHTNPVRYSRSTLY